MSRVSDDLRVRTKCYASGIIRLFTELPKSRREVDVIGNQLLRSGTSVAANLREASRGRSDEEFCSKVQVSLQEADESLLWLELLEEDCGIQSDAITHLQKESNELIAIFTVIVGSIKRRIK